MLWLYFIIAIVSIIFLFFRHKFSFFKRHGFPFVNGRFPAGSIGTVGFKEHMCEFLKGHYEKYKNNYPAFGIYMSMIPVVIPTDPELVKDILVRHFDNFHDRGFWRNEKVDPLSGHLFFLGGQAWKDLRVKLSPTFTSGKMKMMFPIVSSTADRMIDYLKVHSAKNEDLEMKEIFSSFTTEVITNVAFGLEVECLGNPNNEFRKMAKTVLEPSGWQTLRNIILFSMKWLALLLNIGMNSKEVTDFFMGAVRDNINYREKNKIVRNDFFQLLMNLRNSEAGFTLEEIAANSFVFFLAGFDTSSATMTLTTYELALNPDIQKRLRDEINEVTAKHNGEVTYDAIMEMKYLDMVFNESLRKYPVVDVQFRKAERDFPIKNSYLVIPANTMVIIPTYSFHTDERYFENPEKFDPERFNEENVKKIQSFTYLPFSEGPRNCIGQRFGIMQTKIGLAKLIQNFKVMTCDKTSIPLEFKPNASFLYPKDGMWLKFEKI